MDNKSTPNFFGEVQREQGFQIKDFLIRYVKYLPLLMLCLILSFVAAKIKIKYTTEKFSTSGTMFIKQEEGFKDKDNVESLFTDKGSNDLLTEIELMKSRSLMRRVVHKLGLQNSLKLKGKVKTSLVYGKEPLVISQLKSQDSMHGFAIEITVVNENTFNVNNSKTNYTFGQPCVFENKNFTITKTEYFNNTLFGAKFIIDYNPIDLVASNYLSSISIDQLNANTRLLNITAISQSPYLCVDLVNNLMVEYIAQNQEGNRFVTEISKKFIDERVVQLEDELGGIETKLKNFRESTDAINVDAQSQIYINNVEGLKKELSTQQLLIGASKSLYDVFKNDPEVKNVAPFGTLDDVNLQNLILEFNKLQLVRKTQSETESGEGFALNETINQIKLLRSTIMAGLSKIMLLSEANATDLEKKVRENALKLDKIPYLQKELLNYERDREIKEELYLFLKKKGEEAGITAVTTLSNSKVIDPALINKTPIEPVRKKIYSIFLFLGLLIPAALAYLIEIFNDKVRYRDDIQKLTRTPILAEVGHSDESQTLVVVSKSRKVVAEQFRMIRTNIQFLVGAKDKFAVLVTSTFSGEGKSFVSTNIAAAMALTGKKTVLLEFDLRKPKVLEGLKMSKSAGISNFVVGKVAIEDIIRQVPGVDNLFVIGCGAIPPNPAELLLENNVKVLFEYLKANFDVIIIDSAPVGLVTDSMTLSNYADSTLYIVRHKYTLKKQIKLIDEMYTSEKLPKLSIVINDVIGSTGGYYGYGGYGYGYGKKTYGYGTGYFEEEQKSFFKDAWKKVKHFLMFWK